MKRFAIEKFSLGSYPVSALATLSAHTNQSSLGKSPAEVTKDNGKHNGMIIVAEHLAIY